MAVTNVRYVVHNFTTPNAAIEYTYAFDTTVINLDVIKREILKCENWQQFDEVIATNVNIWEVSQKTLEIKNGSLDLLPRRDKDKYLIALAQSISQKLRWGGDECIIWYNEFFSLLKKFVNPDRNPDLIFEKVKNEIKDANTKTKILTKQEDLLWSIFEKSDRFKRLYYQLKLDRQKVSPKKYQEFNSILNAYNNDTTTLDELADLFRWFTPLLKRKWQQQFFNQWLQNALQNYNLSIDDLNQYYERQQEVGLKHGAPDQDTTWVIDEEGELWQIPRF